MPIGIVKEELQQWFVKGDSYELYLEKAGASAEPWRRVESQVELSQSQQAVVNSFVRTMNIIVLSGIWCGDCSAQGPIYNVIASASPCINMRWLDRDEAISLSNKVKINAGNRVPTVLFLAEDYEPVSVLGDRTLSRYRAIARRQLGPACDLPGASIEQQEIQASIQDWLNEFERVQLLLRLSARLRQKHGD